MRKIAPEADRAITTIPARAAGVRGENRLKLTNRMNSQNKSTARNTAGRCALDCSYRTRRVCRIELRTWMAWFW